MDKQPIKPPRNPFSEGKQGKGPNFRPTSFLLLWLVPIVVLSGYVYLSTSASEATNKLEVSELLKQQQIQLNGRAASPVPEALANPEQTPGTPGAPGVPGQNNPSQKDSLGSTPNADGSNKKLPTPQNSEITSMKDALKKQYYTEQGGVSTVLSREDLANLKVSQDAKGYIAQLLQLDLANAQIFSDSMGQLRNASSSSAMSNALYWAQTSTEENLKQISFLVANLKDARLGKTSTLSEEDNQLIKDIADQLTAKWNASLKIWDTLKNPEQHSVQELQDNDSAMFSADEKILDLLKQHAA